MKKVNLIYDDVYSDTDVIVVPDDIYERIETLSHEFDSWLWKCSPRDDPDYWVIREDRMCCNLNTAGFIKWLNRFYCIQDNAYILEEHVPYSPNIKCVEF